ncbi:MAG TPA: prephenate dehydrogenase/arogenate dehydrogenase family protein [Candidatus Korarchaeota archaeon]|nr:prephenate dehydrogenase/arogenate dehydrogenase family protein [Candidatus Korarchaeota archaeon]
MRIIGIIGTGKMGAWIARFMEKEGYDVFVYDIDHLKKKKLASESENIFEASSLKDLTEKAEIIVLAVPIRAVPKVARELRDLVSKSHIVIDISSTKVKTLRALSKLPCRVLGVHPLFGPSANDLKGKKVILTPVDESGLELAKKAERWLRKKGAFTTIMSAEKHDRIMELILALTHFIGLVTAITLSDYPLEELQCCAGPTFTALQALSVTVAMDSPEMLADIQTSLNSVSHIQKFLENALRLAKLIENADITSLELEIRKTARRVVEKIDQREQRKILYKIFK